MLPTVPFQPGRGSGSIFRDVVQNAHALLCAAWIETVGSMEIGPKMTPEYGFCTRIVEGHWKWNGKRECRNVLILRCDMGVRGGRVRDEG